MPVLQGPVAVDSSVTVAPDSTGKKIDNTQLATGAGTVQRQRVSIGDPAQNLTAAVTAASALSVDGSGVTQPVSSGAGTQVDGHSATIGTTTDTSSANTLIGLLKKLISLIPTALGAGGGLKVDGSGTALPISATNLDVALSTRLKPADTLTAVTTVAAVTAITNALPAGTNRIGSVRVVDSADADQTSVKGTQASRGLGTQDLKDAGRSQIMLSWEEMAGTAAAESALTNFTLGSKAAAALSAASSYTVTTGKTLRIQAVTVYIKSTSTAAIIARFRIRQAASSIANSSPVIFDTVVGLDAATFASGQLDEMAVPIPDGLEVAATQQITFTWFTNANTCTVGMTIIGYEY